MTSRSVIFWASFHGSDFDFGGFSCPEIIVVTGRFERLKVAGMIGVFLP